MQLLVTVGSAIGLLVLLLLALAPLLVELNERRPVRQVDRPALGERVRPARTAQLPV
ncbi:hypothetical protein [Amycolatopsis cihanbeyliensis]|uniref:Uncharacterized protein n=1 Tax=Amycolatopsis cihanbeyliensis TaxID=1128664 RepID=A0A542DL07_AMYCI|nr:hypothetical protein [Amycolatopsis cihanbeyliensis]TQJ03777.1 hypothetical protein FB471_3545 [Amycolatopsis cihanbeyliensis]